MVSPPEADPACPIVALDVGSERDPRLGIFNRGVMAKFKRDLIQLLLNESARTGIPMSTIIYELIKEHELAAESRVEHTGNVAKDHVNHMIADAFERHRGNFRQAALELGIPKSTFHDRARKLGLAGR